MKSWAVSLYFDTPWNKYAMTKTCVFWKCATSKLIVTLHLDDLDNLDDLDEKKFSSMYHLDENIIIWSR